MPLATPAPQHIFEGLGAYQHTAVLMAGIQLGVFTAIGGESRKADVIASTCKASERGIRILCDSLTVFGYLTKTGVEYSNTPSSAMFLDRAQPSYVGDVTTFLNHPDMMNGILFTLADAVRKGGTMAPGEGSVEPENPLWVTFARAMGPMMSFPAKPVAEALPASGELKVLDIAAGHGQFGIAVLKRNAQSQVTAVDWAAVLEVARENAEKAGVADRMTLLSGSAFDVDFGTNYDAALVTNFLHHFDAETNVVFLKRVHAALKPGAKVITFEFVPNDDRITPPMSAIFSMVMLASTPRGDAYTFAELDAMYREAGFGESRQQIIESGQSVIITTK